MTFANQKAYINKLFFYYVDLRYMIHASNINIKTNYVLIKPQKDIDKTKSGIWIQPALEDKQKGIANTEARHYNITGTILRIPERLVYRGEELAALRSKTRGVYNDYDVKKLTSLINGSIEFKTDMDVEIGDTVWFDYLAHINANTDLKSIHVRGHGECFFLEYTRLYLRERKGERLPLNGNIFIKKMVDQSVTDRGMLIPEMVDRTIPNHAVVAMIGKPNEEYLVAKHTDHWFKEIQVGDHIIYNEKIATPLEYSIHQTDGLENLWKIRRKDIQAKVTDYEMIFESDPETKVRIAI